MVSNRNLLFQWSIFRGYVSFREGNHEHNHQNLTILFFHCNSKSGIASIHYHLPSHLTILFATYPCFTTVVPCPSLQICFSTQHRRQPGCGMDCITNLQKSSKNYQLSPENWWLEDENKSFWRKNSPFSGDIRSSSCGAGPQATCDAHAFRSSVTSWSQWMAVLKTCFWKIIDIYIYYCIFDNTNMHCCTYMVPFYHVQSPPIIYTDSYHIFKR